MYCLASSLILKALKISCKIKKNKKDMYTFLLVDFN